MRLSNGKTKKTSYLTINSESRTLSQVARLFYNGIYSENCFIQQTLQFSKATLFYFYMLVLL